VQEARQRSGLAGHATDKRAWRNSPDSGVPYVRYRSHLNALALKMVHAAAEAANMAPRTGCPYANSIPAAEPSRAAVAAHRQGTEYRLRPLPFMASIVSKLDGHATDKAAASDGPGSRSPYLRPTLASLLRTIRTINPEPADRIVVGVPRTGSCDTYDNPASAHLLRRL